MQLPLYLYLQTGLKDTVSFHLVKGDASEKFLRNICIYACKYDVCFDCNNRILLIGISFVSLYIYKIPFGETAAYSVVSALGFVQRLCPLLCFVLVLMDSHPIHFSIFFNLSR